MTCGRVLANSPTYSRSSIISATTISATTLISSNPLVVVGVRQHVLNENPFGLVVDSDNQPEVVSANVEHGKHLLSHRNTVGGRISLTNLLEAFPFGGFGVPIPGIQGSTDPAVLRKLRLD